MWLSAHCPCRSGHQPDRAAHPGHPERRHLQVAARAQWAELQEDVSRAGRPPRGADARQAVTLGVQQQTPLRSEVPRLPPDGLLRVRPGDACPPLETPPLPVSASRYRGGWGVRIMGFLAVGGRPAPVTLSPQGGRQALLLSPRASSPSGSLQGHVQVTEQCRRPCGKSVTDVGNTGQTARPLGCPGVFDGAHGVRDFCRPIWFPHTRD